MDRTKLDIDLPEALVADFAADPLSPYDKVLMRSGGESWPLHGELNSFLDDIPYSAVEAAYLDNVFVGIYGRNERLARIWLTQNLLIDEASRRRLIQLGKPDGSDTALPYSTEALMGIQVDDEQMVQLSDLEYNGSGLTRNGFSFVTCLINQNFNSTYWLQQAFYEQNVSNHISVRLDPYLWGPSNSFPQMMYKMLVYAKPLNWEGIARLREPHHGKMRPHKSWARTELTEFCWTPRDDGIHFVCEELPRRERVNFEASRYLHAIYDPTSCKIIHFDGALRIYKPEEIDIRLREHLRNSGKAGTRRKIFRTDMPIDREAFSLIAQAFFIWNDDLVTYFRETLSIPEN